MNGGFNSYSGNLNTGVTSRLEYKACAATNCIELTYAAIKAIDTFPSQWDTGLSAALTMACAIEYAGKLYYGEIDSPFPVTLDANKNPVITVPAGNTNRIVYKFNINLPEGATFYVRTFMSGTDVPYHARAFYNDGGTGTPTQDSVIYGSNRIHELGILTPVANPWAGDNTVGPISVAGNHRKRSVLVLGDSIIYGAKGPSAEGTPVFDSPINGGWLPESMSAQSIPNIIMAKDGYLAQELWDETTGLPRPALRNLANAINNKVTDWAIALGTNDINQDVGGGNPPTAATVKARIDGIASYAAQSGKRVVVCTASQFTNWIGARFTVLHALNDLIRATTSYDVIDFADAIQVSRNSNSVKAGILADTVHPSRAGVATLRRLLDARVSQLFSGTF
jgi:lysophospholipase L1-like esterase